MSIPAVILTAIVVLILFCIADMIVTACLSRAARRNLKRQTQCHNCGEQCDASDPSAWAYCGCCFGERNNEFYRLYSRIGRWSDQAFGGPVKRPSDGALKHLREEADEALAALLIVRQRGPNDPDASRHFEHEMADCLILVMDSARRAGVSDERLLAAANEKMTINEQRKFAKPPAVDTGEPIHRIGRAVPREE